ncbi:hypothetical protein WN71_013840 [Streptomyces mangrovisoli]|uniref:Uncharacterized protein n=1 Tax=Streptomyces mangrovisoli TaxID=1428628 RepID=A0A1J4NXY4_9ACTN|nr:hypothetical protein WN71_013840 [Streptomyces mangrovisoli]
MAMTLTTPAPRIVPYTPKYEASLAATTAATALPATWGTLRSSRFLPAGFVVTSSPVLGSSTSSGLPRIPGPCLTFLYLIDMTHLIDFHGLD